MLTICANCGEKKDKNLPKQENQRKTFAVENVITITEEKFLYSMVLQDSTVGRGTKIIPTISESCGVVVAKTLPRLDLGPQSLVGNMKILRSPIFSVKQDLQK